MAKKGLHISKDLTLPTSMVTATALVLGGKGMGKTNFGSVVAEELSKNSLRFAVVDPMGVWWGIRHSADGRGKGVECLILGGVHGDIPIEPTGGAVIADLVVDENANVIIDISRKPNGEMWSIGERVRFMTDYGCRLFARQGSLLKGNRRREPLCQIIDEAARFIPQMIRSNQPQLAECVGIWAAIVEEGRNIGLGVFLITQRSARINKDVAELADMMMAFRTVGPNSVDAVTDWLGAHVPKAEINKYVEQLRSLPVGSCLAVSPGWLQVEKVIAIRHRETFDSSATPKPGETAKRVHGDGAKPNLALYAEKMRETIERAKETSVPELQKQIRELKLQLGKKPAAASTVVPAKPAVDNTLRDENKKLRSQLDAGKRLAQQTSEFFAKRLVPNLEDLKQQVERLGATMTYTVSAAPAHAGPPVLSITTPPFTAPKAPAVPKVATFVDGDVELSGKAMQIAAIAAGYAARGEGIDKKLMAAILGVPMNGSYYNRLSDARTAGAIITDGSMIRATPEGIAVYSGKFKAPDTTQEVLNLWLPKLPGGAKNILNYLVGLRGESVSRSDLAEAMGVPMNGSFYNRLSEVRGTGLLKESGKNVAINPELLFM